MREENAPGIGTESDTWDAHARLPAKILAANELESELRLSYTVIDRLT